jgi:putative nucleotidyltransferase with HDIG domain
MRNQQLPGPDEFHVQAGAGAVGDARRRIVLAARRWSVPLSASALADVELCASEIITNALTHAGDECWVRTHWTGQFLQVEVTDRSLRPPVASSASPEDTRGRGLAMVECFSHTWGWVPKKLGKTVFFVVAGEAALTGTPRLSALVRAGQARITLLRSAVFGTSRRRKTHTRERPAGLSLPHDAKWLRDSKIRIPRLTRSLTAGRSAGLASSASGVAPRVNGDMVSWASQLAHGELAGTLPRRWAHSQGVAARASSLAAVIGQDSGLLHAAAVLHDIGYAPRLATTGFHPLDGARFLRDVHGRDERLVRLVANHSFALMEAEERGLREDLEAEFPLLEGQLLVDALLYCDMTTTPDGKPTTARARVAEIVSRYGADSVVGRFIRRAEPGILAAVGRVEAALELAQPR